MDRSEKTVVFVIIGIVAGCILLSVFCAGLFLVSKKIITAVPSPAMPTAAVCNIPVQADKRSIQTNETLLQVALETRTELDSVVIPTADLNVINERFNGVSNSPIQLTTEPINYQIGDRLDFYKINADDEIVPTTANLQYATEKVYFWAEDGLLIDKREVKTVVDIFSNEIYPTNQSFFGTEWIPGVDNDPHLFVLYARDLGDTLAGYASSTDSVLPHTHSYSNAHEMFVINADEVSLTDPYMLSTMAHEMQHVILNHRDPNEELWLNEGFSELATLINDYDSGGFDYWFTLDPDMQLTNWNPDPNLNDANYGASYLFTTYLFGRFGESITREIVTSPLNGMASLDQVFLSNDLVDSETGRFITSDDVFQDWTITNFVNEQSLFDGRYHYSEYPNAPKIENAEWLNDCQGTPLERTVHQYGTDYFQISCDNPAKLTFTGDPTIELFPDENGNESYFMWSNRGDSSESLLSKEFDLSGFSGSITLNFDVWYDLEPDYDYAYILASVDGVNWQILQTDLCSTFDPTGNNYGCAYNGNSSGWTQQQIDISKYSGKKVTILFNMIHDGGLTYNGFAVDNLSIPEIGYFEDFESGEGGWTSQGFSRIRNRVPQSYLVSLINSDPQNPIRKYRVDPGEELILDLDMNCFEVDPILVVSGISGYSRQLAEYQITLME